MLSINSPTARSSHDAFYGSNFRSRRFHDSHPGNRSLLKCRSKNSDLIVLSPTQSQVIKTAWRDSVSAVKSRHIGPAQGQIGADDRFDAIITQNKIADNPISLLTLRELGGSRRRYFQRLGFRLHLRDETGENKKTRGTRKTRRGL